MTLFETFWKKKIDIERLDCHVFLALNYKIVQLSDGYTTVIWAVTSDNIHPTCKQAHRPIKKYSHATAENCRAFQT